MLLLWCWWRRRNAHTHTHTQIFGISELCFCSFVTFMAFLIIVRIHAGRPCIHCIRIAFTRLGRHRNAKKNKRRKNAVVGIQFTAPSSTHKVNRQQRRRRRRRRPWGFRWRFQLPTVNSKQHTCMWIVCMKSRYIPSYRRGPHALAECIWSVFHLKCNNHHYTAITLVSQEFPSTERNNRAHTQYSLSRACPLAHEQAPSREQPVANRSS